MHFLAVFEVPMPATRALAYLRQFGALFDGLAVLALYSDGSHIQLQHRMEMISIPIRCPEVRFSFRPSVPHMKPRKAQPAR